MTEASYPMNADFLREAPHRNLPSRYTLAPTEGPRRHNRGLDSRRESSPSAAESRSFGSRASICDTDGYAYTLPQEVTPPEVVEIPESVFKNQPKPLTS